MSGPATGDAYARLSTVTSHSRTYGTATRADAVLFVDLDAHTSQVLACGRTVRDLPFGQFVGVSTVVFRYPDHNDIDPTAVQALCNDLSVLLERIAPNVLRCMVLIQPFGEPAQLYRARSTDTAPVTSDIDGLLRRLRAVELSALLEANHAVWRPADYHFALPSGSHISSFVRLADGFNGPRDAHVITSWLLAEATASLGYVFDNRSLTPLAVALESAYRAAGVEPGPMSFLEHYPDSQFAVEAAAQEAAAGGAGVVGVLSVSSGGSTKGRLLAALDRAGQPRWLLNVLLDRLLRPDAVASDPVEGVSTWLGFRAGDEIAADAGHCPSCASESGRVVAIDPRFFDGMVLPTPKLTMLSPVGAREVAPFWEACDATGAVAIEHKPAVTTKSRRSRLNDKSGTMGVFISMGRLLSDPTFEVTVANRVRQLLLLPARGGAPSPAEALDGIDVVVVGHQGAPDRTSEALLSATTTAMRELPTPPPADAVYLVDVEADPVSWNENVVAALTGSKRVLIVGGSAVSGYTMQRLLIGCQEHLRSATDPQPLTGLLIHARLESTREWTTLRNSYGLRLYTLFDTPLPPHSPLRTEQDTLTAMRRDLVRVPTGWRAVLDEFMDVRAGVCAGGGVEIDTGNPAPYTALLWGSPRAEESRARIRQHSLFGHKLGAAAYFGAVGSAVHRERERIATEPGPGWHLFEMPALLRSYYDPLIIASMLRWVTPSEIWWGDRSLEVVVALFERVTRDDERVLVPEFLLAAAHGKLPEGAGEFVAQRAMSLLSRPPEEYDLDDLVPIAAGLLAWWGELESRRRLTHAALPGLPPIPTRTTVAGRPDTT